MRRYLANLVFLVASVIVWLAIFVFWCWLVLGINGTFGLIVIAATIFLVLAWSRTQHQRRHP